MKIYHPDKRQVKFLIQKNVATKLERGGGKAFVAGPLKKELFLRLPLKTLHNRREIRKEEKKKIGTPYPFLHCKVI